MKYLMIFVILFIGCSRLPFKQVELVPVADINSQEAINKFENLLPDEFTIIDTIVFKYRGRAITGIGYTKVDAKNNNFRTVCLNPAGVKIFEIQSFGEEIITNFVAGKLDELGDVSEKVAQDMKRIYFNRVPSDQAIVGKLKKKIIFSQIREPGILKYVFGGIDGLLIKKKYYEKNKLIWSVSYYRWEKHQGKFYPLGIVFKNYKYDYQLVSRVKEIR